MEQNLIYLSLKEYHQVEQIKEKFEFSHLVKKDSEFLHYTTFKMI